MLDYRVESTNPMSLANDHYYGYIHRDLILEDVTWFECAAASVCWNKIRYDYESCVPLCAKRKRLLTDLRRLPEDNSPPTNYPRYNFVLVEEDHDAKNNRLDPNLTTCPES